MTGLEILDAIILFFGYVFVAASPCFLIFKYGEESEPTYALFYISLIWLIVMLGTLFTTHDFIFYLGVVGS